MALAAGMKLTPENKNVPTGLEKSGNVPEPAILDARFRAAINRETASWLAPLGPARRKLAGACIGGHKKGPLAGHRSRACAGSAHKKRAPCGALCA